MSLRPDGQILSGLHSYTAGPCADGRSSFHLKVKPGPGEQVALPGVLLCPQQHRGCAGCCCLLKNEVLVCPELVLLQMGPFFRSQPSCLPSCPAVAGGRDNAKVKTLPLWNRHSLQDKSPHRGSWSQSRAGADVDRMGRAAPCVGPSGPLPAPSRASTAGEASAPGPPGREEQALAQAWVQANTLETLTQGCCAKLVPVPVRVGWLCWRRPPWCQQDWVPGVPRTPSVLIV